MFLILGKNIFFKSLLGVEKNCKVFASLLRKKLASATRIILRDIFFLILKWLECHLFPYKCKFKLFFFSFKFAAGRTIFQTFSAYKYNFTPLTRPAMNLEYLQNMLIIQKSWIILVLTQPGGFARNFLKKTKKIAI